jgi:transposase, IS5 family
MQQQALSGFEKFGKATRRAQFLGDMDRAVPWSTLCALIEPVYPKVGKQSRSTISVLLIQAR